MSKKTHPKKNGIPEGTSLLSRLFSWLADLKAIQRLAWRVWGSVSSRTSLDIKYKWYLNLWTRNSESVLAMSILQYLHVVGVSWQGVWPTMLQCLIVSCPVEMNMDQSRSIRSWNMRSHLNVNTQELLVVTSPSLFYNFRPALKATSQQILDSKMRWQRHRDPTLWKHFCSPRIYPPQNPFSHIWVLLLAPLWTLDLFSNASHRMRNCVKENETSPLVEVTRNCYCSIEIEIHVAILCWWKGG